MVNEFNILRLAAMPVSGMLIKQKFQEPVLFSWTGNWIVGLFATKSCDTAASLRNIYWMAKFTLSKYNLQPLGG